MNDITVIGAGPSGLCAAGTFLKYDPDADLTLLDAHATLGGAWSREKLYPFLKTNNLTPTLDFFDLGMEEAVGVPDGEHVTGERMHRYLCAYAEHFNIIDKIQLRTKVLCVRKEESTGVWSLDVEQDGKRRILKCKKLVVATGVLSVPQKPDLKGANEFDTPFLHSSELGPNSHDLLEDSSVQKIAVLGGCKSAYDAVYAAASTGHEVEWIIRKSGRGPAWVFPTHTFLGPFIAWRERLVTRRIISFMSPCMFPDFSGFKWLRNVLHSTRLGQLIPQAFWKAIHHDTIRDCGYKTHESLEILQPEQSPFWYGTASGTLSYNSDFFSFIRTGRVRIHREDIACLSPHTVHLTGGTELAVDGLIAATGYSAKPTISFEPTAIHSDLGLPTTALEKEQARFWAAEDTRADLAIADRFPRLIHGPYMSPGSSTPRTFNPGAAGEVKYTPWRLYRGIAPPGLTASGDRSLVFISMFSNLANTIRLEIQCLWALAYMNDKLPSVDRDVTDGKIFEETALFQRFTQHRAPYGHGRFYPDLVFDQLPYWDVLLNDLGLATQRKANGLRELFEPYTQDDYRSVFEEWMQKNG